MTAQVHMMQFPEINEYIHEINSAEAARAKGNEGKARVCARRAAGIIIGEYINRNGLNFTSNSAYDRLRFISTHHETPAEIREITRHFLVKIDTNNNLPIDADLIKDARMLLNLLLDDDRSEA